MRRSHSGQALILALALLAGMLGGFALVFNTGQLVNDKMRLTNATDAAAWSAAQWQARALNFQAYLNRAIIANEVAIAQLVSLRSWSQYVDTLTTNMDRVARYVPYVNAAVRALERGWDAVDAAIAATLPPFAGALSWWNADVLAKAQAGAHMAALPAAYDLFEQVLRANEPRARVSASTRLLVGRNATAWNGFTERYERGGGDLRRFTRLLTDSRDGFTRSRRDKWFDSGLLSVVRRGGTDLIGEYAWRGMDTVSLHIDYLLGHEEIPVGWGAAEVRAPGHATRTRGSHGGSYSSNPSASARAARAIRRYENYQGVPQIRDLDDPGSREVPRLVYAVAAHLPGRDVRTLDRLLMPAGLATLEGGHESVAPAYAEGSLHALASAEVYFQRPAERADRRREYPSLFNPYWQARLVSPSAADRMLTARDRGLSVDPFAGLP